MPARILVVDDTESTRLLVTRTLEREGYRVVAADSAKAALAAVGEALPDLIVSDIMMPDMDGYELLERLRADPRYRAIPVVFLSALGEPTWVEKGYKLGVEHYLVKPFTPAQLLSTLAGTLRRYSELREARVAPETSAPPPPDFEPTGIMPIDDQVGGLSRGRVYLVLGLPGAGKAVLGVQFLNEALERGEHALLVATDRLDTVLYVASSVGLDLRRHIRAERLAAFGLADGFEQLVEARADVVALAHEIAEYARGIEATRMVVTSVLTLLCSTPRLALSAPLMTDFVTGLEKAHATTLLLAEDPVTHHEELAKAYLKRTAFGTIVLEQQEGRSRGRLKLERMQGVATEPEGRCFRVASGAGLVSVAADAGLDVYQRIGELRERGELESASAEDDGSGLVASQKRMRLRDSFVLFLRDCLNAAAQATEQYGLVLTRTELAAGGGDVVTSFSAQEMSQGLSPQEILCWAQGGELAVVALGAGMAHAEQLALRLRMRVEELARVRGVTVARFDAAVVARPQNGLTVDALLEALTREVGRFEVSGGKATAAA
jgi:CheY-like chemotaxis protein